MAYENDRAEMEQRIGFSSADVTENRAGKLTERQRGRLNRKLIFSILSFVWVIVLMVIALMILGLVEGGGPARLFIFAVAGAFMAMRAFDIWKVLQDLGAGSVLVVEGKARTKRALQNTTTRRRYRLDIEDTVFWLTAREQRTFRDGVRYKVYYTPNSKLVVAAEILG